MKALFSLTALALTVALVGCSATSNSAQVSPGAVGEAAACSKTEKAQSECTLKDKADCHHEKHNSECTREQKEECAAKASLGAVGDEVECCHLKRQAELGAVSDKAECSKAKTECTKSQEKDEASLGAVSEKAECGAKKVKSSCGR